MNDVVGHVAHEQVAVKFGRKSVAAVNRDPGRAREKARGRAPFVGPGHDALGTQPRPECAPGLDGAGAVKLGEFAGGGDVDCGRKRLEIGIASKVAAVVHDQRKRLAVGANVRAPPVVHAHAVLATAARQCKRLGPRVEQEALAADGHRLSLRFAGPADVAAGIVGRHVEPVIEAPAERVHDRLAGEILAKAREGDSPHVSLAVAVGVLEIKQVRCRRREDAAVPADDGRGDRHVAREERALVVDQVAVGVFEQSDAADAERLRAGVLVVLGKFGDVEPAVLIEIHGDRALQQGLGGG